MSDPARDIDYLVALHTPDIFRAMSDNIFSNPTYMLFLKAMIAALTSGLGGIPLYFVGELPDHIMGFCIIFAAGLMTG